MGLGVVSRVPRRTGAPAPDDRCRYARSPCGAACFRHGGAGCRPGTSIPTSASSRRWPRLLEQGLDAGALGVTTSRTDRHRTSTGENLGTLRAREPELSALADVLRSTGKGVFQFISDSYRTTDDEFAESEFALIREFARVSRRPVSYTVQQDLEAPERWRDLIALASSLQAEGLDVKAQVAPRPIGVLLGLEASANVFTPTRAYGRIADLPLEERVDCARGIPNAVSAFSKVMPR